MTWELKLSLIYEFSIFSHYFCIFSAVLLALRPFPDESFNYVLSFSNISTFSSLSENVFFFDWILIKTCCVRMSWIYPMNKNNYNEMKLCWLYCCKQTHTFDCGIENQLCLISALKDINFVFFYFRNIIFRE